MLFAKSYLMIKLQEIASFFILKKCQIFGNHLHLFIRFQSVAICHARLCLEAVNTAVGFHGVMVSTQDSESCDPSSNLGGTLIIFHFPTFKSTWSAHLVVNIPVFACPSVAWLVSSRPHDQTIKTSNLVHNPLDHIQKYF